MAPTQRADRQRLLDIHSVASRFYRRKLASAEGAAPLRFLAERRVPLNRPWVVGYAPDEPTALIDELRDRGFNWTEIRASGLTATSPTGRLIDRFRKRVMIGVRDNNEPRAPVVGFVGYAPPTAPPDVARLLHSPASPIFRPGGVLFGLAEQAERTGGHSIIASDPLDAIEIAARTGRDTSPPLVVAPGGASLTRAQVAALTEVADTEAGVAVSIGPDGLGQRSAERAHRLLAPILPSASIEAYDPSGGPRDGRPLDEALGLTRSTHDVEPSRPPPSETAPSDGQAVQRWPDVAQYVSDALRAGRGEPPSPPEGEQLAFDFEALPVEVDPRDQSAQAQALAPAREPPPSPAPAAQLGEVDEGLWRDRETPTPSGQSEPRRDAPEPPTTERGSGEPERGERQSREDAPAGSALGTVVDSPGDVDLWTASGLPLAPAQPKSGGPASEPERSAPAGEPDLSTAARQPEQIAPAREPAAGSSPAPAGQEPATPATPSPADPAERDTAAPATPTRAEPLERETAEPATPSPAEPAEPRSAEPVVVVFPSRSAPDELSADPATPSSTEPTEPPTADPVVVDFPSRSPPEEGTAQPEEVREARPEAPAPPSAQPEPARPGAPDVIPPSDQKARARANLEALRTLATLTEEQRPATPEERLVLGRWASWGAVPQLFDDRREEWEAERAELKALVGEDGYAAARRTTINAHYTAPAYARAIWRSLERLGFEEGRALEPGSGAGIFIGTAPAGAQMTGVELDPATAGIAQALYPQATVRNESFAKTPFPNDHFDAVVGNVPFADVSIYDPRHNKGDHALHNHFIIKSLALTRPGGLVAVLTSRYTLDSQDPSAREEMSAMADLVGAVRLPTGAHRRVAGTEVVTDLLILRRRSPDMAPASTDWLEVSRRTVDGEQVHINTYFDAHPDHILGELAVGHGQYSATTLHVRGDLATVDQDLNAALDDIGVAAEREELTLTPRPAEEAIEGPSQEELDAAPMADPELAEGHLTAHGSGRFTIVAQGRHLPFAVPKKQAAELTELLGMRDTVKRLLDAEAATVEDTPEIRSLRTELRTRYDRYASKYHEVNRFTMRPTGRTDPETGEERYARIAPQVMRYLKADPSAALVKALEIFDETTQTATPAKIMSQRVILPREPVTRVTEPADAVHVSVERHGRVDLGTIGQLLGIDPADARAALGDLVYEDPADGRLVPAAEYLSGNVRVKLEQARLAAQERPELEPNVRALEQVIPPDLGAHEVAPQLGAVWIDAETHQQFFRELLGDDTLKVANPATGVWKVDGRKHSFATTSEWGTDGMNALAIAEAILEQRPIQVTVKLESGRVVNPEATAAAQDKAAAMKERFEEWLWEDPERTARLLAEYNERFNALVLRDYTAEGERLTLPGLAATFPPLRPHQRTAIARMRAEPTVGLFHEVGAGKTAEMAIGTMELKRLGLISKPCVVVPNHMLEQFSREWLQLYPQARVLAASSDDLRGEARRAFVARVATNDWDAVIMTRTAFERLPISAEAEAQYADRELAGMRRQYEATLRAHRWDSSVVKRAEKKMMAAEARLAKRLDMIREHGVSFEQTGIDYLVVDEAHDYKNLRTESKIPGAAIEPGSGRATDLDLKLSYLRERYGTRVATLATATPIANSITEAHVMMRYLCPELLEAAGVSAFDLWAATFAETTVALEVGPTGGYRMKARFARFRNVPELVRMLHMVADVKTAEDLDLDIPQLAMRADGERRPETVVIPKSPELAAYMRYLDHRASNAKGFGRKGEDNMGVISSDGRQAAVDLRLVADIPSSTQTKLEVAARTIAETWRENKDRVYVDPATEQPSPTPGALQFVFCDMGTPSNEWNAYDELRELLVAHGLPRESVRFIHEAKSDMDKARLFAAARTGQIAVLIGSTQKMGVGVNAQARAGALHHIDCPWRPADVAQREGRILRQGNQNEEVRVIRYVVEGSFDAYTWQTVERKAKFINQIMRGRFDVREIEDIGDGALSAAEVKALASGDPLLLEKAQAEVELTRLERLNRAHDRNRRSLEWSIDGTRRRIETDGKRLERARDAVRRRQDTRGEAFAMTIDGRRVVQRAEAAELLRAWAGPQARRVPASRDREVKLGEVGQLGGQVIDASLKPRLQGGHFLALTVRDAPLDPVLIFLDEVAKPGTGVVRQLENRIASLPAVEAQLEAALDKALSELAKMQNAVTQPFKHAEALTAVRARVAEIDAELKSKAQEAIAVKNQGDALEMLKEVLGDTAYAELEAAATDVIQREAQRDDAWWVSQRKAAQAGLEELRSAALKAQLQASELEFAETTAWVAERSVARFEDRAAGATGAKQLRLLDIADRRQPLADTMRARVTELRTAQQEMRDSGRHPAERVKRDREQVALWIATAWKLEPEAVRSVDGVAHVPEGPAPVVPGTVTTGLPESLQPARGAIAELEAAALTDLGLTQAARASDKGNFALAAREWIDNYVVTKAQADGSSDFVAFRQTVADTLNEYIIDRVWALREVGTAAGVTSIASRSDMAGDARLRWIEEHASQLAGEIGEQAASWWRAAARDTLSIERDKRIALEAACEAASLAADYEALTENAGRLRQPAKLQERRELAAVQRTNAVSHESVLASGIEAEWKLFDSGRHLSGLVANPDQLAARLVAAERIRGTERKFEPPPSRVAEAGLPDVGASLG